MGNNETVMGPIVTTVATLLYNLTDDDPSAAAVAGAVGLNLSATGSSATSTTRAATTTRPTRATTAALTSAATTAPFLTTDPPPAYDIRDIIRLGGVDYGEFGVCSDWLPINHIYFQLANIFLFLSYLAPNGIYGILYLRITLTIGCMFFALWGWVILCAFDTFLWNAIFVLINLVHVIVICYYLRPVRFTPELEQVSSAPPPVSSPSPSSTFSSFSSSIYFLLSFFSDLLFLFLFLFLLLFLSCIFV